MAAEQIGRTQIRQLAIRSGKAGGHVKWQVDASGKIHKTADCSCKCYAVSTKTARHWPRYFGP